MNHFLHTLKSCMVLFFQWNMNVNILNDMKEQNKSSPYVCSHILVKFQAKKQSIVNSVEMYEALQSTQKSLFKPSSFFLLLVSVAN